MKLWIARDKQDYLGLYYEKPTWKEHGLVQIEDWYDGGFLGYLDNNEFPEVTFENSPQEVELTLCNHIDTVNIQDCNPKKQTCVLTNHGIVTDVIFK